MTRLSPLISTFFQFGLGIGFSLFFSSLYLADLEGDRDHRPTGESIGIIERAQLDVLRRPRSRLVWLVPEGSARRLYAYDTIKTGADSTALLNLGSLGSVQLGPNSLVILEPNEEKLQVNLASGDLFINGSLTAKIGNTVITTASANVGISRDHRQNKIRVQTTKGDVQIDSGTNVENLKAGDSLESNRGKRKLERFGFLPQKPGLNAELMLKDLNQENLFSWSVVEDAKAPTNQIIFQLSEDARFQKRVRAISTKVDGKQLLANATIQAEGRLFGRLIDATTQEVLSPVSRIQSSLQPKLSWVKPDEPLELVLGDQGLALNAHWITPKQTKSHYIKFTQNSETIFESKIGPRPVLKWKDERSATLYEILRKQDLSDDVDEMTFSLIALDANGAAIVDEPISKKVLFKSTARPPRPRLSSFQRDANNPHQFTLQWEYPLPDHSFEIEIGAATMPTKKTSLKVEAVQLLDLDSEGKSIRIRAVNSKSLRSEWLTIESPNSEIARLRAALKGPLAVSPLNAWTSNRAKDPVIQFQWNYPKGINSKPKNQVVLIRNTDTNKVTEHKSDGLKIQLPTPEPGNYEWVIKTEWAELNKIIESPAKKFTIERHKPSAPRLRFPASN